jgi:hypothetical protein
MIVKVAQVRDVAIIEVDLKPCADVFIFRVRGRELELCGKTLVLSEELGEFRKGLLVMAKTPFFRRMRGRGLLGGEGTNIKTTAFCPVMELVVAIYNISSVPKMLELAKIAYGFGVRRLVLIKVFGAAAQQIGDLFKLAFKMGGEVLVFNDVNRRRGGAEAGGSIRHRQA